MVLITIFPWMKPRRIKVAIVSATPFVSVRVRGGMRYGKDVLKMTLKGHLSRIIPQFKTIKSIQID